MSADKPLEVHQSTKSYKHMWARGVAQKTMAYDLQGAIDLVKDSISGVGEPTTISELNEATKELTGEGFIPKEKGKIDVGIVGAGVAGLFAALLFDWLNDHPKLKGKGLKINYDILEAAGAQRLGGRLYTHHFSDEEHDYYDVGAMRFPNNSIMKRTFQLFQYIGITPESKPGLIPYYLGDKDNVCPSYFNDVSKRGDIWADKYHVNDPYKINKTLPPNGQIPKQIPAVSSVKPSKFSWTKFRTAWWQKEPFNIKKGGVSRTDLPLRVCVYPSYNIEANEGDKWDPEKPAVLLCSYTWGQDAQRIGSLCSRDTPNNEEELKRLMIHDLARLHARKEFPFKKLVKFLEDQYIDHHGYDWYRDQHMSGAFAYFGPGQFSNMWQEIIKPNSFGQLYLVGEAASSHHAWIVGALESVIRAVYVMFQGLQNGNKEFEAYRIVLDLLRQVPTDDNEKWDGKEDILEPLKRNGAMPAGLPFHPLPEEMPSTQIDTANKPLTDLPENEIKKGYEMSYGAALAVLSVIESFFELGLDKGRE
ncbi:hypothetical protein FLONG3_6763 [Fusarium longipes]|uniref:Amine oxidase domain-containing protein n=1 Tax=Fusarium longipes TaxID=694270 RepID=A0A395SJT6_9HYPO|nr:hypothetical protein FLONG3_6763 [Fusarium longipes]